MHLEFMRIVSTAYDSNDLVYREHSSAHNFAYVSPNKATIVTSNKRAL